MVNVQKSVICSCGGKKRVISIQNDCKVVEFKKSGDSICLQLTSN